MEDGGETQHNDHYHFSFRITSNRYVYIPKHRLSAMDFYVVYVTAKDEEEAGKIAIHLLEKRLIACANMFPIKSLYWWKGKIERDDEVALIMKTQKRNTKNIISEVKALHSYDVPCIEFLPIQDGNPDYMDWIRKVTTV